MKIQSQWLQIDVNSFKGNQNLLELFLKSGGSLVKSAEGVDLGGSITGTKTFVEFPLLPSQSPTQDRQAANKLYVDQRAQGLRKLDPNPVAASTINLAATYDNGSDGEGATLTATSNGALTLDTTITPDAGDSVLIMEQTNSFQNGIYVVTTAGDGSTPWVLTRRSDFDGNPDTEMDAGAFVYVEGGSTRGNCQYNLSEEVVAVGTDPVVFALMSSPQTITVGDGLEKDGTVISVLLDEDGHSLDFTPDGEIFFNMSDGLHDDGDGAAVKLLENGGLGFSTGSLTVKTGDGTVLSNGTVNLRITPNQGIALSGTAGSRSFGVLVNLQKGVGVDADGVYLSPGALIRGGGAELDGDRIDIDFNPSNYTPDYTGTPASNSEELAAHLNGIDEAISKKSGAIQVVKYHTLTATDQASGYFQVQDAFYGGSLESVDIGVVGGCKQRNYLITGSPADFKPIAPNRIDINSASGTVGLSGDLSEGVQLLVTYQKAI